MRLLLVEDDVAVVDDLLPRLRRGGYAVEWSDNGLDGDFLAREESFDLVILDLGLPGCSGLDVLTGWRRDGLAVPVLVLTARDTWHERVDGLKAGADDYLGKPFHVEELLARIESIIHRSHGQTPANLRVAGLTLDTDRQTVTDREGRVHCLTGIEFRLLRYMMLHPDRYLSKTELSEHIYEEERLTDSNVIEVYINRLRQRLGRERITNRRGQGYRLTMEQDA
ncbi:response regulator transcription factor [Saccharospirillum salsuginis]|uniref:DNA-binding response regulator n=1 Tax=Saccharospirillum salsuginis TaxID=418750 RepID=A0A918K1D9_9GAMM|nr:response regulator transcription factor [Saccharospirillum salsuginis]GGX39784.1 DNA-binding response regulator [Saccharospirillum salsuginis]